MSLRSLFRSGSALKPWYQGGLAFACERCGACCRGAPGYVWITEEEIRAVARRLNMSVEEFSGRFLRTVLGRTCLRERENGDCMLLDKTGRACLAYEERPVQCRAWPWWHETLASPEAWEAARRECPGIGTGPIHPADVIEEQRERDRRANG
ncbi:MAG: YkgJ family cysteine cluster protein [Planctomycetota bacterium]